MFVPFHCNGPRLCKCFPKLEDAFVDAVGEATAKRRYKIRWAMPARCYKYSPETKDDASYATMFWWRSFGPGARTGHVEEKTQTGMSCISCILCWPPLVEHTVCRLVEPFMQPDSVGIHASPRPKRNHCPLRACVNFHENCKNKRNLPSHVSDCKYRHAFHHKIGNLSITKFSDLRHL